MRCSRDRCSRFSIRSIFSTHRSWRWELERCCPSWTYWIETRALGSPLVPRTTYTASVYTRYRVPHIPIYQTAQYNEVIVGQEDGQVLLPLPGPLTCTHITRTWRSQARHIVSCLFSRDLPTLFSLSTMRQLIARNPGGRPSWPSRKTCRFLKLFQECPNNLSGTRRSFRLGNSSGHKR